MFLPVAVSAYYGGFGPGLAAVLVTMTLGNYLFVPPAYSLAIPKTETMLSLLAFSVTGVVISALGELVRRALARDAMEAELRGAAQDGLIANEERLRIAESALAAGVWDWDIPQGKTYWSDGYRRLMDYPLEEEASFESFLASIHPDDRERVTQHLEDLLRKRLHNWAMEFRVQSASGKTRWVRSGGHAFYDESGHARRMVGINVDITAQKASEQEIRDNETRMRLLLQYTRVGGWEWNIKDHTSNWSDEFYQVVGIDRSIRPSFESLLLHVHPDDREYMRDTIRRICDSSSDQFQYEYRIIGSDGVERYIHERGMVLRSPDAHCRLLGVSFDISNRREEETLENVHQ